MTAVSRGIFIILKYQHVTFACGNFLFWSAMDSTINWTHKAVEEDSVPVKCLRWCVQVDACWRPRYLGSSSQLCDVGQTACVLRASPPAIQVSSNNCYLISLLWGLRGLAYQTFLSVWQIVGLFVWALVKWSLHSHWFWREWNEDETNNKISLHWYENQAWSG